MSGRERHVLLQISDSDVCKKVRDSIITKFQFSLDTLRKGKDTIEKLDTAPWQYDVVVIYDDVKKNSKNLDVLREIKKKHSEIEVIYIIAPVKNDRNDALYERAFCCFFHPFNYEGIAYSVKSAKEKAQFRRERKMLEKFQPLTDAITSAERLETIIKRSCEAAVEIFEVSHSALVLFGKHLVKGRMFAQYPEMEEVSRLVFNLKGVPAEERLIEKKESINIYDVPNSKDLPNVKDVLEIMNVKSILIVPVVLRNKVIASFSLDMIGRNRHFYQDEIKLLKKLANRAAIAIGKFQRMKELSVLNQIGNLISHATPAELDVKRVLELIIGYAQELLDMSNIFIALWNDEKKEYSFPLYDDHVDDYKKYNPDIFRTGLTDFVRRTQKSVRLNRKQIDALHKEGEIDLIGVPACIWLGAPLIVRKRVLGVLVVQSYENENAYDDIDLKFLETIASRAAIAIDNIQLLMDAKRRIRDLELVNNIVGLISSKLETDPLLQEMVAQIKETLKCNHCTLFFPKKTNGEILLTPRISHGKGSKKIMSRRFKPGEGLAGWVFEKGESLVSGDARLDGRYAPPRSRANLPHSMLVVPVKMGDRTIGVISAEQDKSHWFGENDRQLVDALARHAGIAIERAIGLKLLQDIGSQIISTGEVKKIFEQIISGAIELTNTSTGVIYLLSKDRKSIDESYTFPPNIDHLPPRMEKKDGFTRLIVDRGKMIIVSDLSKDPRVNHKLLKDLRSMIGVPLKMAEKVIGVLFLHDKEIRDFTEIECSLLKTLANQAAITIYNSKLFRDSRRQLSELSALLETSQEIVKEYQSIGVVLSKILERAVELSNAKSGQILFREESTGKIKIGFTYKIDKLKGKKFQVGEGMTSIVFDTGKAKFTNDYHNEPYKLTILDKPEYRNLFKALAEVPLIWKGEVLGILAVSSNHPFTDDSIRLLERFAGPAAIAIAIAKEMSFRQALLDNSPDAIVAVDTNGTVKEFNRASEQIFEYEKEEVLDKSVVGLWGGYNEAKQISRLLHLSKNGTVSHEEVFVENKNGEKIPVLFSGSLLYSEIYGDEKEEIGSIGQIEDQRIINLRGRTKKLFDAIEEINRTEELPKLVHVVLHWAIKLLEADSGYIMLARDHFYEVVERYNINEEQAESISILIKEDLFGPLIKKEMPHKISDFPSCQPGISMSSGGKSGLILLLENESNIIGLVYLESSKNSFFQEENELLQLLSSEAAVAINRAQLKEESEQLQRLKEIGDKIRVEGEFEKYKDIIVETSRQLLKSEISTIFLYDKNRRCLYRGAWYPKMDILDDFEEKYSGEGSTKGITGEILGCEEGVTDHIIYFNEDKIFKKALPGYIKKYKNLPSWKKEKSGKSPIKNYLAVPMYGEKGKVFGALRVMNKISKDYSEENPFLDNRGFRNPEDIKMLKTIASLLAQALSSERKANKLRMLHEITDAISSKTDIKGVGDCIAKSIVNRFGYSACSMRLVRGDYLELISKAGFSSNKLEGLTVHKNKGLVGKAIEKNQVVFAYDIFSDDDEKNGGYLHKSFAKEENIRSACCVPIKGREGDPIGVITIYMRHAPYDFEDYEVSDNFSPISATCSIALRKVQAVDHLQKLVDLLGMVHLAKSKHEILHSCVDEMLDIFDAQSTIIYETRKTPDADQNSEDKLAYEQIYTRSIDFSFDIPRYLLVKIKKSGAQTLNSEEFPKEWHPIKKQYSQCLIFALEFQEEILGLVMLFTKVGIPFILHEVDKYNLASAISRQLAIAFKNIEITDEIERMRVSQPAIISAQYVSGMIHELASIANKGKAAATHIRGTGEYRAIKNIGWKVEMSKIEAAFDDIGNFTTRALEIKDIGRMKFRRNLEYRSINAAIQRVLYDTSYEARKKLTKVKWNSDKNHDKMHAYFDEILIKQTIRNLISNSIRWISDSGNGEITITSGEKGEYIFIQVKDNGVGIEKEIEESIFEPFFTTSTTGYGIGLFFVKNVVKMHEGKVILVSNKNPTIFEIQISSKLKNGGKSK